MSDIFRDNIWQFFGTIFAAIGVGVAIVANFLKKPKKALSFEVVYEGPLVSVHDQSVDQERMTILLDGQIVNDIDIILLELYNSGSVPIRSNDYESELRFVFNDSTRIVDAELALADPEDLMANIKFSETSLSIEPVLLNAGDSIRFKLLVTGFANSIIPYARIAGVKTIEEIPQYERSHDWQTEPIRSLITKVILTYVFANSALYLLPFPFSIELINLISYFFSLAFLIVLVYVVLKK